MAKEVLLRFLGDAKQLNATFAAVDAQTARSMAGMQASVASAGAGVTSKLGAVASAVAASGASMRSIGRQMTFGMTLPLAFIGKAAVGTAIDYERSMNVLQAVSGATGDQMGAFGRLAQQLGADIRLPGTSAADAGEAMVELAKAGLSVTDTMGAARGVLQLSAAGGLSNAEAATVAANALNAFRLEGSQASRVADLLAGAANASSAEVADLAASLQMSGAVFAAAGLPIEDLITSVGLLANVGIKGSDAGTSLKTMLMRLQDPSSKEAAETMKRLGISVYDAAGNMRPMRAIIGQFTGAMGGLTQEQRNAALATIFGADAVRAANAVLLGGTGAFDAMKTATTEQGAAAKLAAARNKGLGGALDALKSAMETFALQVVLPALPVLTRFVTSLAAFLPTISALPRPVILAGAAFVGLLAALGPLSFIAGAILSPLGRVAAALTAVGFAIYAAINPAKAQAAFGALSAWVQEKGPEIVAHLGAWGRAFLDWVLPLIPPLLVNLGLVLGAIGTWILTVGVPAVATAVRNFIPAFTNWLGEAIPVLWLKLGEFGRAVIAWTVTDALPMLIGAFLNLGVAIAGGLIEGLLGALKAGLTHALNFLISTLNRALTLIDQAAGPLINFGEIPQIGMAPATGPPARPAPGAPDNRPRAGPVPGGGMLGPAPPAPATAGNAGRMIPMARGGLLLGLNRPTPILAGEGRGREDVLAVPHSKGGIGGMGGVTQNITINGAEMPTEAALEYANRQLGWKLALAGRR